MDKRTGSVLKVTSEPVETEGLFSGKGWFAEVIKDQVKELNYEYGTKQYRINMNVIAERVGLNVDRFKKIRQGSTTTRKRDCILAICAAVGFGPDMTNKILRSYHSMPCLDTGGLRDKLISEILRDNENEGVTYTEINYILEQNNLSPLDIKKMRKKSSGGPETPLPKQYIVKDENCWTEVSSILYGDSPSKGLEDQYSLSRYICRATMTVENLENKTCFRLSASSRGEFSVWNEESDYLPSLCVSDLSQTEKYKPFFVRLHADIQKELNTVKSRCNDTKNYYKRVSANYRNGSLHIFAETYNYTIPEMNEYFLMEYVDGEYTLTHSTRSQFMEYYLVPEEYEKQYGTVREQKPRDCYPSIQEITDQMKKTDTQSDEYETLRASYRAFDVLRETIEDLLVSLRRKGVVIRDYDARYDIPDYVCAFFGVEKEYKYTEDSNTGEFFAHIEKASFDYGDGEREISISDLKLAYELGVNTIDEVYSIIVRKGSVEGLLY